MEFNFYSPEEEINFAPITSHGVRLFMKRDDLIHPFISGNKWRKLKYNLIHASVAQKKRLVSFGGAYSNHILALAAAGAKFGFKTTAFIRGEEVSNPVLEFCKLFGMRLIFVSRDAYRDKQNCFNHYFEGDDEVFFIDEGGYGQAAAQGCREIIDELNHTYDAIFCAAGTGATAAGIINALAEKNLATKMNVISALKGDGFLKAEIDRLLVKPHTYELFSQYHFGGYAKTNAELLQFIQRFATETGVLLDPVYTGKTLFAIQDYVSNGYLEPGSKILMVHTGGLFGILGMLDRFKDLYR